MRALNVLLAILVSLFLAGLVIEVGLRLLGFGPQAILQQFDPLLGWSKIPNIEAERSTSEFDAHFKINALGLRDDPMTSPAKPEGKFRVVMLGDSFVQGYTVERDDLFVDQLERWWQAEGRDVDVINAGTEGYSTDQEVLWFLSQGAQFQPDLVILFPYENDLYWNSQEKYQRFDKPRFNISSGLESRPLTDPGPRSWLDGFATGKFIRGMTSPLATWSADGERRLQMEWGAYFHEPPPFMLDAYSRTKGALNKLKDHCAKLGVDLVVAPIPNKASILPDAQKSLERSVRVDTALWSADRPVDTFLSLCAELSIPTLDARARLRAEAQRGESLYYHKDWHFDPAGNRAFARFLHDELAKHPKFAAATTAARSVELPAPDEKRGMPTWIFLFAGLWTVASALYAFTYKDEPLWQAALKVGLLLACVFGIVKGGSAAHDLLPAKYATGVTVLFVMTVLGFVLFKLGRRVGTIAELMVCFVGRGHWYLMPLVVVLLSVGSLLVVAASSPLIAPFIYTLF